MQFPSFVIDVWQGSKYTSYSIVQTKYAYDSRGQTKYASDSRVQTKYASDFRVQTKYAPDFRVQTKYAPDPRVQTKYASDSRVKLNTPLIPEFKLKVWKLWIQKCAYKESEKKQGDGEHEHTPLPNRIQKLLRSIIMIHEGSSTKY